MTADGKGPEQHDNHGPGVPPPPPAPAGFPGPFGHFAPPPAPKPGVIPLRPLDLGDILGGLLATVRQYWRPLYALTLAVLGGAFLICAAAAAAGAAAVWGTLDDVFSAAGDPSAALEGRGSQLLLAGGVVGAVWLLVILYATAALHSVCSVVVSRAVTGAPATAGEVWREARPHVHSVLGTQLRVGVLLAGLILVGYAAAIGLFAVSLAGAMNGDGPGAAGVIGFLFAMLLGLACIGAVVFFSVRFSLAPASAVLEKSSGGTAMGRSWRLVQGSWWRVFGITLLVGVIVALVGQVLQYAVLLVGALGVAIWQPNAQDIGPVGAALGVGALTGVSLLLALLTEPFARLTLALLYVDVRIRREGLDLALATAAGVPPHRA